MVLAEHADKAGRHGSGDGGEQDHALAAKGEAQGFARAHAGDVDKRDPSEARGAAQDLAGGETFGAK